MKNKISHPIEQIWKKTKLKLSDRISYKFIYFSYLREGAPHTTLKGTDLRGNINKWKNKKWKNRKITKSEGNESIKWNTHSQFSLSPPHITLPPSLPPSHHPSLLTSLSLSPSYLIMCTRSYYECSYSFMCQSLWCWEHLE